MSDLEERVTNLETQLGRRCTGLEKQVKRLTEELAGALKRLNELAEDVGGVLEARECESDSDLWSRHSNSEADGTTLSDDGSSSSVDVKAAPVRLSKVVQREYGPIDTGRSFAKKAAVPLPSSSLSLAKKYLDPGPHSPIEISISDEQPAKKPALAKKPLAPPAKKPKADTAAAAKKRKVKE